MRRRIWSVGGRAFWLLLWILLPMGFCLEDSEILGTAVAEVSSYPPANNFPQSFKLAENGTIYAYDNTGNICWTFATGGSVDIFFHQNGVEVRSPNRETYLSTVKSMLSGTVVHGNELIMSSASKIVFYIDPMTGKLVHKIDPNETCRNPSNMLPLANSIVFQRTVYSMRAYDKETGQPVYNASGTEIGVLGDQVLEYSDNYPEDYSDNYPIPFHQKTAIIPRDMARGFTPLELLPDMNNKTQGIDWKFKPSIENSENFPNFPSVDVLPEMSKKNTGLDFEKPPPPVEIRELGDQKAASFQGRGWISGGLLGCLAAVFVVMLTGGIFFRRRKQQQEQEQQMVLVAQQSVKKKNNGRKRKAQKNSGTPSHEAINKQHQEDEKTADHDDTQHKVGNLVVGEVLIGTGSNGTRVLEGFWDERPVAIKCILATFYDKAVKEIQALMVLDTHPNVVRYFAMERDKHFVYIALEKGRFNLGNLVKAHSDMQIEQETDIKVLLQDLDVELWDSTLGLPTPVLMKLMRDIVDGLVYLHSRNYMHRDLKPENVLIYCNDRKLVAKVSDMGISKKLDDGVTSSLTSDTGSKGWKAPEQIQGTKQTRAVDMFNLGCLLFFCISCGKHPFGDPIERDFNITRGKVDTFPIDHIPEATNLVSSLLELDPTKRLSAVEARLHPFFWPSQKRLSFLIAASDRVEREDREVNSAVLADLEAVAPDALDGSWKERLDEALVDNLGKYRNYNFQAVRDLLRVIRNKANHYRELPSDVQQLLGVIPQGYENYFRSRFPKLLMEVYKVLAQHCWNEDMFATYFADQPDAYA